MKRIITLLLIFALALSCFASCDLLGGKDNSDEVMAEAVRYLKLAYSDGNGSVTPINYQLSAKVPIGDDVVEVTWTCDLDTIELVLENGLYTVKLPEQNAEAVEYTLTATLTYGEKTETLTFKRKLPVISKEGIVTEPEENVAYKLFVSQNTASIMQKLYAKADIESDQYIQTSADAKEAADYYAEKSGDGFKFYTNIDGAKKYITIEIQAREGSEGKYNRYIKLTDTTDTVWVYNADRTAWVTTTETVGDVPGDDWVLGIYGTYETISLSNFSYYSSAEVVGVSQFPLAIMTKAYAETLTPDQKPVAPGVESITISKALELAAGQAHDTYTLGKYSVTGVIDSIANTQYGNMTIKDANGDSLYIYGTWSEDGTAKFEKIANKPAVGDTITVIGVLGTYNDTKQMKNGWIVGTTAEGSEGGNEGSGTTITPAVPEAGKLYNLTFLQGNTNKIYHVTGAMSSYYFATTEDVAGAAKIGVEATTGGFHIYVDGAAKSYINVVVSGTHINGVFGDTASTVWTYNETLKTLTTVLDEVEYVLGTRNDKEYTTIGPVDIANEPFYAYFVAAGESGEGGEGGESGETPAPTFGTSEEAVNAAYELAPGATLGTQTVTGVITSIKNAYDASNNCITVVIVVGTLTDKPIECYKLTGTGIDTLAVGDTITVTGELLNYRADWDTTSAGKVEFNADSVASNIVAHTHTYVALANKCDICSGITTHECVDANTDKACDLCGEAILSAITGTLNGTVSFTNAEHQTSFSSTEEVWNTADITITHKKGSNDLRDPITKKDASLRVYGGATLTVACEGTVKIVVTIDSTHSDSVGRADKLTCDGATAVVEGNVVTFYIPAGADSVVINNSSSSQIRLSSIAVYTEA